MHITIFVFLNFVQHLTSNFNMESVQDSLHQMMVTFNQRLDTIEDKIPSSPGSPGSLAAELASFKAFVLTTFRALQAQFTLLAMQVDQGEMRARRKILLLHGVPEKPQEDTSEVVAQSVVKNLKIDEFSAADISRCHRMGRVAANKPRPILFKLRDVSLRDQIWSSKKSLKGSGITVSEFLTKARHDVFMAARQRFGVTKCWTREGNVFVLDSEGSRHRVNTVADLEAIQSKQAPAAKPKVTKGSSSAAEGVKPKPKPKTKK